MFDSAIEPTDKKVQPGNKTEHHADESADKSTAPISILDIVKDVVTKGHFTVSNHKSITERALTPEGLSSAALFAVEVGDLAQDLDADTRNMPTHHCDDNTFVKAVEGTSEYEKRIEKLLSSGKLKADDEVKVLYEFGQRMHVLQDFYAHSNYVELKLKQDPKLSVADVPLMNFQDIGKDAGKQIRTGYYYYENSIQNEAVEFYLGRSGIIQKLEQKGMRLPGTTYLPSDQYAKLTSFDERISYATNQKYSVLHKDLNKDDVTSDEGKVVDPSTGKSLSDYAQSLALRETQRQWNHLENTIHRLKGKTEGDRVIKELKNMSYNNNAMRRLMFSIDGVITRIS